MVFCRTDQMPWQLGPSTATPCCRAASAMRRATSLPPSTSSKPALNTITLRMPLSPHSAMIPGTVSAGVMIMATSGVAGNSPTDLYAFNPSISGLLGLTG